MTGTRHSDDPGDPPASALRPTPRSADSLLRAERTTRLGRVGEVLAAELLAEHGFTEVIDLNARQTNYPFADVLAVRNGTRYFIGVKTRNELQRGGLRRNDSYNLVLIRDAANAAFKQAGKTTEQITRALLDEVNDMASAHDCEAAWLTVAVRALEGTYSAYFGTVAALGVRRSVPMTEAACARHECLARNRADARIEAALHNA